MEWFLIGWVLIMAIVLTSMAALPAGEPAAAPTPAEVFPPAPPAFSIPESVSEPIGRYMDRPIYRSIFLGGEEYFFDRIEQNPELADLTSKERLVSPGVIYRCA